jgi:hypothetical protein
MLVVDGWANLGPLASNSAYNPSTDQWRPLSGQGNPLPRYGAAAVWTGTEVAVFGGFAVMTAAAPGAGLPAVAALQILNPQPPWYFYRKL